MTRNPSSFRSVSVGRRAVLIALGLTLALCGATAAHAAGVFSMAYLGSGNWDSSVGLSTNKTYLTAVNFNGGALTINGVNFAASSGGNPSGIDYSLSNIGNTFPGGGTINLTGNLGSLVNTFVYGGNPGNYTLSGLTAGQTYVVTYYSRSWDAAGQRLQDVVTSDGASTVYDVDYNATGQGYGNLLRYTFVATGSTESLTGIPGNSGNTWHTYGLSLEQTFNNSWTGSGNSNWSTLAWSGYAPNAADTNASFPASFRRRTSPWTLPQLSVTCNSPARIPIPSPAPTR